MGQPIKELKSKLLKTTIINPSMSLSLLRKYGRVGGKFEIRVELPQYLRIVNRHTSMKMAMLNYEEMLKMIGRGTPEEIQEFKGTFFV